MGKLPVETLEQDASNLYMRIVQHVDNGFSIPSNRDFADMLNISSQRIIKAMAYLQETKKIIVAIRKVHANPQRQITLCCDGRSTPWQKLKPRITHKRRRQEEVSRKTPITRQEARDIELRVERGEVAVRRYDVHGRLEV